MRADDKSGKRVITIAGPDFIGRFLQHVLPSGFKRIRHYGLLSPALQTEQLARARAALNVPARNAPACEDAAEFLKRVAKIDATHSKHCALGKWRTVQTVPRANSTQPPGQWPCRGPP